MARMTSGPIQQTVTKQPVSPPPAERRMAAPDLARGFMLLGIALANVSAYLWARPVVDGTLHLAGGSVIDRSISAIVILLVDQRVYPMFAFLFGYGIVQFARARMSRGVPEHAVRAMLRRRHLWLIAFGGVHALLLFSGDILGAYGLAGLILTAIFWRGSDTAIKITVWIFVGLSALGALLLLGIGAILLTLNLAGSELVALGQPTVADLMNGQSHYLLAALIRLGTWILATPGTLLALLVPASILLGMLAARHRWLEGAAPRMNLGSVAVWGIAIGTVGALPTALVYLGVLPALEGVGWSLSGVGQVAGLLGGIGYAALFGVIGRHLRGELSGWLWAVSALGKRSLSFYLLQSVIYAPLLAAWGLGLGSTISATVAFAIAVGVWIVSVALAAALEHSGRQGPAETVLRRLTYGKDPEPRA